MSHARLIPRSSKPVGAAPGTLLHTGERHVDEVKLSCWLYDCESVEEQCLSSLSELAGLRDRKGLLWLDCVGLHDIPVIEEIGRVFGLHPLLLEDVLSVRQRIKFEEYDDAFLFVMKSVDYHREHTEIDTEQISFIVGRGFVLSFQERPGD